MAEIKVYVKKLRVRKETKTVNIENTKIVKREYAVDKEGAHLLDQGVVDRKNKILDQKIETKETIIPGYQIYARDVATFVKDWKSWNPLLQAYQDMREEVKKHK